MINQPPVDELDTTACAAELRELTATIRRAEARRLEVVAHWADLHAPTDDEPTGSAALSGHEAMRRERYLPGRTSRVPAVAESAAVELGCLIGVTTPTASKLIADALDLRADLPVLAGLVQRGLVEVWKAQRVITEVAHAHLDADDAARIDQEVSPGFATLPFGRAMTILDAALLAAKSSTVAADRAEALTRRYVAVNRSTAPGMRTLVAQTTTADMLRINAMIGHLADLLLAHGDRRPADIRRAAALVLMANPGQACLLLATPKPYQHFPAHPDSETTTDTPTDAEPGGQGAPFEARSARTSGTANASHETAAAADADPAEALFDLDALDPLPDHAACECEETREADAVRLGRAVGQALAAGTPVGQVAWDKLRPTSVLYLHLLDPAQQPDDLQAVVRPEFDAPATRQQMVDWLGHDRVIVRPVWDTGPHLGVDAYEIPHRLREQVMLRHPYETFPYGTRRSRTCDLDHVTPYRPPDSADPGAAEAGAAEAGAAEAGAIEAGAAEPQTSASNLRPLSRRHHRAKTHAGFHTETYSRTPLQERAATIGQLWRSPTGYWFKVDTHGTHQLDRPLPPSMEISFAEDLYVHLTG